MVLKLVQLHGKIYVQKKEHTVIKEKFCIIQFKMYFSQTQSG